MRFTKMHGIGNDFVFVDCTRDQPRDPAALAQALCRPHFGVGADGLALLMPSRTADFAMRIYNADGSQAQMCGNAARCAGKYLYERGLTRKTRIELETPAGSRTLWLTLDGDTVTRVRVDMGAPALRPADIGVDVPGERAVDAPLRAAGQDWRITCVSMGNPHAVVFVPDDPAALDLAAIGPAFEHHALFPERTNAEFVRVLAPDTLLVRVWERGCGETLACGTGACAALVAAVLGGLASRQATVRLPGGELAIAWDADTDHVLMTGPAVTVFEGDWPVYAQ
ncbi:MAG: diaminopimelate epimerase [Oscillospiraceae bacterium]|jgi:diaminopimelate epimerase|nr:diaminopimelate epimerase [Oscillospiraceae bacterium]